jgi:hypothetical protein
MAERGITSDRYNGGSIIEGWDHRRDYKMQDNIGRGTRGKNNSKKDICLNPHCGGHILFGNLYKAQFLQKMSNS